MAFATSVAVRAVRCRADTMMADGDAARRARARSVARAWPSSDSGGSSPGTAAFSAWRTRITSDGCADTGAAISIAAHSRTHQRIVARSPRVIREFRKENRVMGLEK